MIPLAARFMIPLAAGRRRANTGQVACELESFGGEVCGRVDVAHHGVGDADGETERFDVARWAASRRSIT